METRRSTDSNAAPYSNTVHCIRSVPRVLYFRISTGSAFPAGHLRQCYHDRWLFRVATRKSRCQAYLCSTLCNMANSTAMPTPLAEAASAHAAHRYSEGDPVVLTVYFLAFGFWTAAAGNDFISSTWTSVRATRRKGKLHVVFVTIPMAYICAYIYYQHINGDYKEMGAALLALAFALLHLARTFMGLWHCMCSSSGRFLLSSPWSLSDTRHTFLTR